MRLPRKKQHGIPAAIPVVALVCLLVSCAHAPEELTVDEHRAEALRHREVARQEQAQYRPEQPVTHPRRSPFVESPRDWMAAYNPTEGHLEAADREMRDAAEHLAAAKKLETFENVACQGIPPAERAACPLLASAVTRVLNTSGGIALELHPRVDAVETTRRLGCHLAYAEANGFATPSCPLFVKGMSISLVSARVIEMNGGTPGVAKELQDHARRIFLGEPKPPNRQSAP